MPEAEPFYLIVSDLDRGVFTVEGPMTDDGPGWLQSARLGDTCPYQKLRPAGGPADR